MQAQICKKISGIVLDTKNYPKESIANSSTVTVSDFKGTLLEAGTSTFN